MNTSFRLSLTALVLSSGLSMAGCSPGGSSTDAASSTPGTPSAAATTATPSPTPTQTHGAGWSESITAGLALPEKWQGGKGWKVNIPQGTNINVLALKNSVLLITKAEGIPASMSTYDKDGNLIEKSPEVTQLAAKGMTKPVFSNVWSQGKSYYMMLQGGQLTPDPNSTKAAGWGVFFTSFDTTNGKVAASGMVPIRENSFEVRTHGGMVHLYDYINGKLTRTFIDPATGKTDLNHDPEWEARTDGVDVTSPGTGVPVVAGPNWSLEDATVPIGNQTIADTNLLAVKQYDANDTAVYRAIDVHTGKEPEWTAGIADPSSYLVRLGAVHAGVYAFRHESSGLHTFINPTTGKIVKLTKEDTFKPQNIGADGVIYGTSSAVKGEEIPSYLDLNEGQAKTLGVKGTLMPIDVTGDGLAAFNTPKSLIFVNPATK